VQICSYIEHIKYTKLARIGCKILRGHFPTDALPEDNKPHIVINNIYGLLDYISIKYRLTKVINNTLPYFNIKEADEIIHVHWAFPHGYYGVKIAKHFGIPCVITSHGSEIPNALLKYRTRKYMMWTLKNADKVIFVSQGQLNSALELGYSGKNAVIISNGVNIDEFYPMPKKMLLFILIGEKHENIQ
jgi:glycosyltransferase involved in cell wall biosynthesis